MIERTIATLVKHAKDCATDVSLGGSRSESYNMGLACATALIITDIGLVPWNGNTQDTLARFLAAYDHERETRRLPNTNSLIREAFAQ